VGSSAVKSSGGTSSNATNGTKKSKSTPATSEGDELMLADTDEEAEDVKPKVRSLCSLLFHPFSRLTFDKGVQIPAKRAIKNEDDDGEAESEEESVRARRKRPSLGGAKARVVDSEEEDEDDGAFHSLSCLSRVN
jgi:hypothetical protein